MQTPPPVPVRRRRLIKVAPEDMRGQRAVAQAREGQTEGFAAVLDRTFWVDCWEKLNGEEGAGLLMSLFLHVILLAALAIPVYRAIQEEQTYTTVVQSDADDQAIVDEPINTEITLASPESTDSEQLKSPLLNPLAMLPVPMAMPEIDPDDLPSVPGENKGKAGGEALGNGSMRIAAPKNAIRAGNFSVWPWPIVGQTIRGEIVHAEPGSAPKVFQEYHIVIRLTVPDDRQTVNLSDFSGKVVGSDQYFQKIPHDAWFFNKSGTLIRARTGRSIPVIAGTAELLIRVPAAGSSQVKDTITVGSRLTDEEQEIELQFQPLN